jgi:hypothetical protein
LDASKVWPMFSSARGCIQSASHYVVMSRARDPKQIDLMEDLSIKILKLKFTPGKEELNENQRLEDVSIVKED